MGLGLLPWERWLPPYIFGPLLCIGSILALVFDTNLAWWEFVVFSLVAVLGAWGTWVWYSTGRNIFNSNAQSDPAQQVEQGRKSPD